MKSLSFALLMLTGLFLSCEDTETDQIKTKENSTAKHAIIIHGGAGNINTRNRQP